MDLTIPGLTYHYRILRAPYHLTSEEAAQIKALISSMLPTVGIAVSDPAALDLYLRYPIITLATRGGVLVGYHGMEMHDLGGRWLANFGALYVPRGERRHLGHALMAISTLPDVLRHPTWPIMHFSKTRSPRVVASGNRWLRPFYPDLRTGRPPPRALVDAVQEALRRSGEPPFSLPTMSLPAPQPPWHCVPLPREAWSGLAPVDAHMRQVHGPDGLGRAVVMGEVKPLDLLRLLRRGVTGSSHQAVVVPYRGASIS